MGYRNGLWEFAQFGRQIHDELEILGGVENISVVGWSISDDQVNITWFQNYLKVMHIHTARALVLANSFDEIIPKLKEEYILSRKDFDGIPSNSVHILEVELLEILL